MSPPATIQTHQHTSSDPTTKSVFNPPQSMSLKDSIYFTPDPVLNRTTRSPSSTSPVSINFRNAGKHAAPSGAQKIPSKAPISRVAAINSSSVTDTAVPPESRNASSIKKSP